MYLIFVIRVLNTPGRFHSPRRYFGTLRLLRKQGRFHPHYIYFKIFEYTLAFGESIRPYLRSVHIPHPPTSSSLSNKDLASIEYWLRIKVSFEVDYVARTPTSKEGWTWINVYGLGGLEPRSAPPPSQGVRMRGERERDDQRMRERENQDTHNWGLTSVYFLFFFSCLMGGL